MDLIDAVDAFIERNNAHWNHEDWLSFKEEMQDFDISEHELGRLLEEEKQRYMSDMLPRSTIRKHCRQFIYKTDGRYDHEQWMDFINELSSVGSFNKDEVGDILEAEKIAHERRQKDTSIAELQRQLSRKEGHMAKQSHLIEALKQQVLSLQEREQSLINKIESIKKTSQDDEEITRLLTLYRHKAQASQELADMLKDELKKIEKKNALLKETLEKKEEDWHRTEKKLDALGSRITKEKVALLKQKKEFESKKKAYDMKIAASNDRLEKTRAKEEALEEKKAHLVSLESQLQKKQKQLISLEKSLEEKKAKLDALEKMNAASRQIIAKKQEEFKEREQLLEKREKQLEFLAEDQTHDEVLEKLRNATLSLNQKSLALEKMNQEEEIVSEKLDRIAREEERIAKEQQEKLLEEIKQNKKQMEDDRKALDHYKSILDERQRRLDQKYTELRKEREEFMELMRG